MTFFRLSIFLFLIVIISSCKNCVECTCTDTANDVERICYSEAKDYYSSRREWRDDIKAYEKVNDCECK